ncbi:aromatic ring-hydroxylating dioxygenase subunit alpha [Niallia sp. 01092]|uniref:aromatic ring-hydroxylating dioxygenase subunit alpha n=1 Tax=unclassified Niallia TaxID=2837522 RepID=UPI003FD5DAD7
MFKDPVLAKFWQPAAYSHELTDKPMQVYVLGERIVLFRTSKGVQAFKDLCIHRGAELSLGKVVHDCIVCPYHGWEYNTDGKCVKIPQQPPTRVIPPKAKAVVYSCTEKYGLIWVKLSDDASDGEFPFPEYVEYDDPTFKTVCANPHTMNAAAPRVVENFLDVSHLAFVHEGILGDSNYAEIPDYKAHWREDRIVTDEIPVYADADGTGNYATIHYTFEVLSPTVARLKKVNYESKEIFAMLFAARPEQERKSTVLALVSRNYSFDASDQYFVDFQQTIIEQDTAVVESQKPEELPLDLQEELHLTPDKLSIAYRRWLAELGVTFGSDVGRKKERIN